MSGPSSDPSVSNEPFGDGPRRGASRDADSSPENEPALPGDSRTRNEGDSPEHTVWDEPALRASGVAPPEGALTYASWYEKKEAATSHGYSWFVCGLLALLGGPLAVLGAFLSSEQLGGVAGIVIFGPAVEEILKASAAFYVVERKPYLFKSPSQIFIAVVGSAFSFALIENLLYLYVYIEDPSAAVVFWRWSICTALHVAASSLAALGLIRIWNRTNADRSPPEIALGFPFLPAAVILHGTYNAAALLLEKFLEPF